MEERENRRTGEQENRRTEEQENVYHVIASLRSNPVIWQGFWIASQARNDGDNIRVIRVIRGEKKEKKTWRKKEKKRGEKNRNKDNCII
jgi:hypothetical protein